MNLTGQVCLKLHRPVMSRHHASVGCVRCCKCNKAGLECTALSACKG